MSQDLFVVAWFVASVLVFVMISTGLAQLTVGSDFLPDRVRRWSDAHGWPGARAQSQAPISRIGSLIFGSVLLIVAVAIAVDALVDPISLAPARTARWQRPCSFCRLSSATWTAF